MLSFSFSPRPIPLLFTWVLTITAFHFTGLLINDAIADAANDQVLGKRFGKSVLVLQDPADHAMQEAASDTCTWGTHDSCPEVQIAGETKKAIERSKPCSNKRDGRGVEETIATITASVGSSVGICVQQIIEPFAMVGPERSSSLSEIAWLAKFWSQSELNPFSPVVDADSITHDITDASTAQDDVDFDVVSIVPFADFDGLFESQPSTASLASAARLGSHLSNKSRDFNRIDWQSHDDDRFNLVGSDDVNQMQRDTPGLHLSNESAEAGQNAVASLAKDAIAVETAAVSKHTQEADSRSGYEDDKSQPSRRRLAGSSGFIATIEQVLLPYDLIGGSQGTRNLFPLGAGGYCVLERASLEDMGDDESSKPWLSLNEPQGEEGDEAARTLSQAISHVASTLNRNPQWRRLLRAKNYGRQFGWITTTSFKSSSKFLDGVASHWPVAPLKNQSAGSLLLARADAVAEEEPAVSLPIDQVQIDQLRQTIVSWISKVTVIQDWFRIAQRSVGSSDNAESSVDRLR